VETEPTPTKKASKKTKEPKALKTKTNTNANAQAKAIGNAAAPPVRMKPPGVADIEIMNACARVKKVLSATAPGLERLEGISECLADINKSARSAAPLEVPFDFPSFPHPCTQHCVSPCPSFQHKHFRAACWTPCSSR
jgi:hypothetical protein